MQTPTIQQSQPVQHEADLPLEDQIVFDIDDKMAREKYIKLAKKAAMVASIAVVSLVSGYYLSNSNSPVMPVSQTDNAAALAKIDHAATKKPKQSAPEKVAAKKANPNPMPAEQSNFPDMALHNAEPASETTLANSAAIAANTNQTTLSEGGEIDIKPVDQPPDTTAASDTPPVLTSVVNSDRQDAFSDQEAGTANFAPAPQGGTADAAKNTTAPTTETLMARTTDLASPQTNASQTSSIEDLLDQSLQMFQNKQWENLIELSNKILSINPNAMSALTNRAAANTELGLFAAALADCNMAVRIDPDNPLAINNRGYVYEKMGDFQNAIMDYEHACTLGVDLSCKEAKRLKSSKQ
jgi:tetratricopeptide (TPR) repeat protein